MYDLVPFSMSCLVRIALQIHHLPINPYEYLGGSCMMGTWSQWHLRNCQSRVLKRLRCKVGAHGASNVLWITMVQGGFLFCGDT